MDVKPTLNRAYIESIDDALKVVECVLSGYLHSVSRRPYEIERPKLICSGHIFVFIEEKSGIKRWTDGVSWSPSRIVGKFLVYKELFKASGQAVTSPGGLNGGPNGAAGPSYSYRSDGLIKKALSLRVRAKPGELKEEDVEQALNQNVDYFTVHIISYYTLDDISNGILLTPSELEPFRGVVPSQRLLEALEMSSIGNNKTVRPPKFKHRDRPKSKAVGVASAGAVAGSKVSSSSAAAASKASKKISPRISTPILGQFPPRPFPLQHSSSQMGSHNSPIVLMPPLSLAHQLPQPVSQQFAGSPSAAPYGIHFQYHHQPFPLPCPNPQYPQEPYNSYLPALPMPQPVLHTLPALAPYQTPHQSTNQGPGQYMGPHHRQLANTSASITFSTSASASASTSTSTNISTKPQYPVPTTGLTPGPVSSGPASSGTAPGQAPGPPAPVKP